MSCVEKIAYIHICESEHSFAYALIFTFTSSIQINPQQLKKEGERGFKSLALNSMPDAKETEDDHVEDTLAEHQVLYNHQVGKIRKLLRYIFIHYYLF